MSDIDERPDPVDPEPAPPPSATGLFTMTADAEVIRGDQSDKNCEESR